MQRCTTSITRIVIMSVFGLCALSIGQSATSQMVTGAAMDGFDKAFQLSGKDVMVQETDFTVSGKPSANVIWPGQAAAITFHIKSDRPYSGNVRFETIQYGTSALPNDIWKPHVFAIKQIGEVSAQVDITASGKFVTITPPVANAYGGYAIVLDVPGRGRYFGATLIRSVSPETGRVYMPTYALDLGWPFEMSPRVFNAFKKMGIKGARVEGGYNTISDAHPDWAMENDVTLMLCVGCGNTPASWQPTGRGRPYLTADGALKNGEKEDLAWLPQYDPQIKAYLKGVVEKYGWPRGPVNAVELWNEPWEGVSISGWGADMLRYRQLYHMMADAVLEARKEAGVKVMIGGTCSSTNTRDKLFCDGKLEFLPILDFVSIHYQALAADPALEHLWMSRTGEYGRVKVWDTESWVGNSDDRVAAIIASMRSMGQDRTAGIFYGNVNSSQKPVIDGKEYAVCQVWSPGAAVAAVNKMIGQRAFKEILFKNGLPWVYVFDGLPGKSGSAANPEDATMVIVGDLGKSYERGRCLFRSVGIAPEAHMELTDAGFVNYDFYGNPLPSHNGKISIPINGLGYYLRTNGKPGSFAKLRHAVETARIVGVEPVEIVAKDMTSAVSSHPAVRIQLTNVLNRPVTGTLSVQLAGYSLNRASESVRLAPHETRECEFTVRNAAANPENNYPLLAKFTSEGASPVQHSEVIHVNLIAHRTIAAIDGNLEHWKGVIPQKSAHSVDYSMSEKAYLPFKDWTRQPETGPVTAYLAYDDHYFYFAASVPAIKQTIRYGSRDDDSYFYPAVSQDKDKPLTWPEGVRRYSYRKDPDLPGGHNIQIAFNVVSEDHKIDMWPFPAGTEPHYCSYHDTDYEFALNPCVDGGAEIFCLNRIGAPRKNFYPRQPKAPTDGGPLEASAKLAFTDHTLECAIPWTEMPEVWDAIKHGKTVKFTFRSNEGSAMELAAGRSISKINPMSMHPDWSTHWANELEFGAEK